MSEMNQDIQQQPTTPTPEAAGDQGEGRVFSQSDVNRIVSERLAREKAKAEPSPEETREAELKARETRLSCREYLAETGYPAELLELLDTSDFEKFKAAAERLDSIACLPSKNRRPVPRLVGPLGGGGAPYHEDPLQSAFKPPEI